MNRIQVALSIAIALAAGPASANLIGNGSFEEPVLGGGYTVHGLGDTGITGWTVVGTGGNVALVRSPLNCCGGPILSQDGDQLIDLAGTADNGSYTGLEQSVATTVGQSYRLSFHAGTVAGLTTTIEALAGGISLGSFTGSFSGPSTYAWTKFDVDFVASATSTAIRLMTLDRDFDVGLDNVSLEALAPGDVPEPEVVALFGLALAGIGLRSGRRAR